MKRWHCKRCRLVVRQAGQPHVYGCDKDETLEFGTLGTHLWSDVTGSSEMCFEKAGKRESYICSNCNKRVQHCGIPDLHGCTKGTHKWKVHRAHEGKGNGTLGTRG